MPFGLKNVEVTYQTMTNSIFHDYMETFMQIYTDDIVIKSAPGKGHLDHLQQSFKRMRKHTKTKPSKACFLCVGWKFPLFCFP